MRDYVTTVFNLIVGLVDADKIVFLALIGLGVVLVWQLLSLLTNFHRKFALKCRKISKFLTKKGLSADNYNQFLALIAKMPQEFIRGYKTFEHASYGLPSDYIKRFDSIDVEVNGGLLNHGKSLAKAVIYGWTIILFVLSLALLGNDVALTGFALADALIVPVLFLILAKVIYFIFNAIKQQQYRVAVDEFNEMLDIMNDKIENNDNLPGPDVLAELMDSVPTVPVIPEQEPVVEQEEPLPEPEVVEDVVENQPAEEVVAEEEPQIIEEPIVEEQFNEVVEEDILPEVEEVQEETVQEVAEDVDAEPEYYVEPQEPAMAEAEPITEEEIVEEQPVQDAEDVYTEEELVDEINVPSQEPQDITVIDDFNEFEALEKVEVSEEINEDIPVLNEEVVVEQPTQEPEIKEALVNNTIEPVQETKNEKEEDMEEKRGRGRPKKIAEGELVIKNDKQFEEVLQRAEKLMRKSEEALSSSQAKRVEKSLKDLIDAMTKYKEEH